MVGGVRDRPNDHFRTLMSAQIIMEGPLWLGVLIVIPIVALMLWIPFSLAFGVKSYWLDRFYIRYQISGQEIRTYFLYFVPGGRIRIQDIEGVEVLSRREAFNRAFTIPMLNDRGITFFRKAVYLKTSKGEYLLTPPDSGKFAAEIERVRASLRGEKGNAAVAPAR